MKKIVCSMVTRDPDLCRMAYVRNSKPIHINANIYRVIHLLLSNNIDPHVIMSLWLLQYLTN